jgi:quinol monooxygenase YgiN
MKAPGLQHRPCGVIVKVSKPQEDVMPTIAADFQGQTVITTFEMTPGTCQDLLDELTEAYEKFIRHQPGFIAAGLHVNDAQTRIANYSQWRDRKDFQAMLRTAEMRERNRRIAALCSRFEPVMYEVAAAF